MKAFNKKLNKRKTSKVTLKRHSKSNHPSSQDELKDVANGVASVRPEDIKIHQN